MNDRSRWLQLLAVGLAVAIAVLLGVRFLLTPVKGELLVVTSARQSDRLPAAAVALHSSAGWLSVGSFNSRAVPAAPQTATLVQASVAVGVYDAVRIEQAVLPLQVQVVKDQLVPILVVVADGVPPNTAPTPAPRASTLDSTSWPGNSGRCRHSAYSTSSGGLSRTPRLPAAM